MNGGVTRRIALATIAASVALFLSTTFATAQKKSPPASPVDLNSASAAELQQIPGIGPTTAQSIVHMREKSGRCHRVEDLLAIHGISQARLEKIRPYVFVTAPPAPKSP
jgi:competence ComEA-like helix-hairpin-helix protein